MGMFGTRMKTVLAGVASVMLMTGVVVGAAAPASAAGESFESVTPSTLAAGEAAQTFDFTLTLAVDNTWRGSPTQGGYYLLLPGFNYTGLTCGDVTFTPTLAADAESGLEGECLGFEAGKGVHFTGPYITGESTRQYTVTVANLTPPQSDGCYRVGLGNWDGSEYLGGQSMVVGAGCPNTGGVAPEPRKITIRFDNNGVGFCKVTEVTGTEGLWTVAPKELWNCQDPTGEQMFLQKYNTSPDGSGITVVMGGNLHLTGDNTLYAQWTDPAATPGAPRNVKAVPGRNLVTVTWDAPEFDGNAEIVNYLVRADKSGQACITRKYNGAGSGGDLFTCTFDKPAAGQVNTYTVQALNWKGWGAEGASNPVAAWNLQLTDASRAKKAFGLRQAIDMGGKVWGLPANSPVLVQWQPVRNADSVPVEAKWEKAGVGATGKNGSFQYDKWLPFDWTKKPVALRMAVKDPATGAWVFSHHVVRAAR